MLAVNTTILVPVGLFVFMLVALIVGYYTRRTSDIELRPSDGLGDDAGGAAPGAEGKSRIAGKVEGEHDEFDTHGTQ